MLRRAHARGQLGKRLIERPALPGAQHVGAGDLISVSAAELRAMSVDELKSFGFRIGLQMEDIETTTQALTRLVGAAYRVEA